MTCPIARKVDHPRSRKLTTGDRYRHGVVIVISQVAPRGWLKLFEDAVIAEAIVDRRRQPSQGVVLKGGPYRERLSNPSC